MTKNFWASPTGIILMGAATGGTGGTLTGIVSALISTGMDTPKAAHIAAKANRWRDSWHLLCLPPGSGISFGTFPGPLLRF